MALAVSLTSTVTCRRTSLPGFRRTLRVQSRASSNGPEAPRPQSNLLQQVKTGAIHFSQKYDILSTSTGALVCTSFFWSRGQDPLEALWITFCATIAGLVINEVMFEHES
ncbi:hypothetical protein WJX79_001673 [Trebouxia sp. C0005]